MMPHWLSVLFLLAAGAGLLAVAYHGYRVGELRAGPNFWRGVYRPNREDNPVAFHFFLFLYSGVGLALCVWGCSRCWAWHPTSSGDNESTARGSTGHGRATKGSNRPFDRQTRG